MKSIPERIAEWQRHVDYLYKGRIEMPTYTDVGCERTMPDTAGGRREVRINPCLNGYVIDVGCKRLVFETADKLLMELGRYLRNPGEVEKEYLEKYKGA